MTDSPQGFRQTAAYIRDMRQRGIFGAPASPRQHAMHLKDLLTAAGWNPRCDHRETFVWHAALHHLNVLQPDSDQHAWTVAIYETETFTERLSQGLLTPAFDAALLAVRGHIRPNMVHVKTDTCVMRMDKFAAKEIPRRGIWAAFITDVDDLTAEPHLVWNSYEISANELKTLQLTKSHSALLPLNFMTAHHAVHMGAVGISSPRLMLSIREPRAGVVMLDSMAVELRFEQHPLAKWTRSLIGETIDSVLPIAETPDGRRSTIADAVLAAGTKHRVSDMHGYLSTRVGQSILGRPGDQNSVASSGMAMLALAMAVAQVLSDNADKLSAKLKEFDPRTYANDVAPMSAELGVEAMFAVLAPSGRASPVLAELKRIFGDKGVPSIEDMMNGNSGLPHNVPSVDAQRFINTMLATKVDMDANSSTVMSEKYLAQVLSDVSAPRWASGRSPLALAVLVAAMPFNFVQQVQSVLVNDLNMPNAAFKHAGSNGEHTEWPGAVAPGVYVVAPLQDYDRAAKALATKPELRPISSPVYMSCFANLLAVVDAAPGTEFEARQLHFCAHTATVLDAVFAQSDALAAADQSSKIKVSLDKMRVVVCLKGTTQTGTKLWLLMDQLTGNSLTVVLDVVADHAGAALMDFASAMITTTEAPAGGGQAVAALARTVALNTQAINAYAPADSAPAPPSRPADDAIDLLMAMRNAKLLPVRGSLDTRSVRVISADANSLELRFGDETGTQRYPVCAETGAIGTDDVQIKPARVSYSAGGAAKNAYALSIGPQVYVQASEIAMLHAAQNSTQSMPTKLSAPPKHNPFGDHPASQFNASVINASGMRDALARAKDPRLLRNVAGPGTDGFMHSVDARNDWTTYFGAHSASPFK